MEPLTRSSDGAVDIPSTKLTCDELIRTELDGKFKAVERYDAILWKIRSGYVGGLYGALALIGGSDRDISSTLGNEPFLTAAVVLIWGFSFCGFLIDVGFSLSKLRVVLASDKLYLLALRMALGELQCEDAHDDCTCLPPLPLFEVSICPTSLSRTLACGLCA